MENCKIKIGMLGFKCKCNNIFCSIHRLPEDHNCDIPYKDQSLDKLKNNLLAHKINIQKITNKL